MLNPNNVSNILGFRVNFAKIICIYSPRHNTETYKKNLNLEAQKHIFIYYILLNYLVTYFLENSIE